MRRYLAVVPAVLLLCAGCTGSDPASTTNGGPSTSAAERAITLDSLQLDWPKATGELDPGARPATPAGFDDAKLDSMASILTDWAQVAAVDDSVWHSASPVEQVADAVPASVAKTLRRRAKAVVSPRLALANVFADDVTVIGSPQVTTAWKVSTAKDEDDKPYVLLELQTRTAYEVRVGADGPTRVIGMLRVQGLSAFDDTTDDFGASFGWQEFGAGDCALALDDDLLPDADADTSAKDLRTFVKVGNGKALVMPELGVEEQVDSDYLKRCREGSI